MAVDKRLLAPCGLYCGVCGIFMAHRDDSLKFKERLVAVYGLKSPDEIRCDGCQSDEKFGYCRVCPIRDCCGEKEIEGCHECEEFPCPLIETFPLEVGKKVILRAIPAWRELGTEAWVEAEEKRYHCPECDYPLFRGARRCRNCGIEVDVD